MNRVITCVNRYNMKGIFSERAFGPFLLADADGLYEMVSTVNVMSNTMTDGASYQSAILPNRNIVLTLKDISDYTSHRTFLNELFVPKSMGTLYLDDGDEHRKIDYYVEKVASDGIDAYRTYQVSLLCPDPYFYDLDDSVAMMAEFLPSFHFAHEFNASKEEFGYRQKEKIMTIANYIGVGGTGMTIEISCIAAVTNPVITHIETGKSITIGTDSKPLSMEAGDKVAISTYDGNKHVYLTHDGTTTKINNYLSEDSVFLQLGHGENSIGYSAKEGVDNMIVRITYKLRYASA